MSIVVTHDKSFTVEKVVGGQTQLSYGSYLRVEDLLKLQSPLSSPAHHDEYLFIIIHQAYELWFKLMLHEIDASIALIQKDEVLESHHKLTRVNEILKLAVSQIHILETMRPVDFLRFRDKLNPASGFQSAQFREIEFACGLKEERFLKFFLTEPSALARLKKRLAKPDLGSELVSLLERKGFFDPVRTDHEARLAGLAKVYSQPQLDHPLYLLLEKLVDLDEQLVLFRTHHVHVVERLIASKPGTGGSTGVEYLKSTLSKRCFPLLWEVRAWLV